MTRRLSLGDESGMTIVELLVTFVVGTIVMLAAYNLLDATWSGTKKIGDRVDSTQRGRLAMDEVIRQLRSQVCVTPGSGSIIDGRDDALTFYSFTGTGAFAPEKHTIQWSSSARTIVDYAYVGQGTPPAMTYPAQPTRSRMLLSDVQQAGSAPIFSYYAWSSTTPVAPSVLLRTPLSTADAARTVRVTVQFRAFPAGKSTTGESIVLQDEAFARVANPNAASGPKTTQCT
jgi:Tfp pilus assembly protein PilV